MTAAERAVEAWNRKHPAKTPITVITETDLLDTETVARAFHTRDGEAVVYVEDLPSPVTLDRIRPRGKAALG